MFDHSLCFCSCNHLVNESISNAVSLSGAISPPSVADPSGAVLQPEAVSPTGATSLPSALSPLREVTPPGACSYTSVRLVWSVCSGHSVHSEHSLHLVQSVRPVHSIRQVLSVHHTALTDQSPPRASGPLGAVGTPAAVKLQHIRPSIPPDVLNWTYDQCDDGH